MTTKQTGAKFENVELEGYFQAGTELAYENLGNEDRPSCVVCGSPLKHCWVTDHGIMGGDCLATLTGDNKSRSCIRRMIKKLDDRINRDSCYEITIAPCMQNSVHITALGPSRFDTDKTYNYFVDSIKKGDQMKYAVLLEHLDSINIPYQIDQADRIQKIIEKGWAN